MPDVRLVYMLACAVGALNGLLLAGYAAVQRKGTRHLNRLLALLLLTYALRVSKSILVYFQETLHPFFDYVWVLSFAMTPLVYAAYGAGLTGARATADRRLRWYLLPTVPVMLAVVVPSTFDPLRKVLLAVLVVYGFVMAYWVGVCRAFATRSAHRNPLLFRWALALLVFMTVNWIIYVSTRWIHFNSFDAEARVFSAATYVLILLELRYGLVARLHAARKNLPSGDDPSVARLRAVMETERPYLDSGLTLVALAKMMKMSRQDVSALLNTGLGVGFNDYVNGYRITECKARMAAPGGDAQTIESIAFACGFNSLSSFYVAFRKQTGTTPAKYAATIDRPK